MTNYSIKGIKNIYRHEEVQMVKKPVKRCSTTLLLEEYGVNNNKIFLSKSDFKV